MNLLTIVERVDELPSLRTGSVEPLHAQDYQLTKPLCHLALQDSTGALVARCSLWGRRDSHGAPVPDGLIGHYAAANADAGKELLERALDRHRAEGRERVIGPMDGSTWHRYRLLTDRGSEPTFFMEPTDPDEWPIHFTDVGFAPLATYTSALNADLSRVDPRSDGCRADLERSGVTLRTLDIERFEDELAAIHKLSLTAFANNFLYSPIEIGEFLVSYVPIRAHIIPELIFLAEHDGHLAGFIFAIPDLLESARGEPQRTVVVKSMAVHPDYGGNGLGGVLMDDCQRAARNLGFVRAIHALMQETNLSRRISRRYGTTIRRYTLYEKPLSSG